MDARATYKATEDTLTRAAIGCLALRLGLVDDLVQAIEELSASIITELAADATATQERREAEWRAQAGVLRELRAFQAVASGNGQRDTGSIEVSRRQNVMCAKSTPNRSTTLAPGFFGD